MKYLKEFPKDLRTSFPNEIEHFIMLYLDKPKVYQKHYNKYLFFKRKQYFFFNLSLYRRLRDVTSNKFPIFLLSVPSLL